MESFNQTDDNVFMIAINSFMARVLLKAVMVNKAALGNSPVHKLEREVMESLEYKFQQIIMEDLYQISPDL